MASEAEPRNETDLREDATWINERTGKEMKCESQQTSRLWEQKPLAEILQLSVQGSQPRQYSKNGGEESRLDERKGVTFSEEVKTKEASVQVSSHRWQKPMPELRHDIQPEEQPSHREDQHPPDSQLGSQQPEEWQDGEPAHAQAPPENPKSSQVQPTKAADVKVDRTWISQKSSSEKRCKSQQTSFLWERKPLSEILQASGQKSKEKRDEKQSLQQCDFGSKTNRLMTLSFTEEGEEEEKEKLEGTYSVISLSEGILLNKKTGKILISCSQQTSEATLWTISGAALDNRREAEGAELGANEPPVKKEHLEQQENQQEMDSGRHQPPSQQFHHERQKSSYGIQVVVSRTGGEDMDTCPKYFCVSEETLLRMDSYKSFVTLEDDSVSVYEEDFEKEGSFINTKTGKLLYSQCLQTDGSSFQEPRDDNVDPVEKP